MPPPGLPGGGQQLPPPAVWAGKLNTG